jgi:hypothetical protein
MRFASINKYTGDTSPPLKFSMVFLCSDVVVLQPGIYIESETEEEEGSDEEAVGEDDASAASKLGSVAGVGGSGGRGHAFERHPQNEEKSVR